MATTTELRSLIVSLSDQAAAELAALWAHLATPDEVRSGLFDVMPALVGDYGDASAAVSAEWYNEYRAGQGVGGSFTADVYPVTDLGADALAGWGSSLITPETDWDAALEQITGGLQRRIATSGRETITNATHLDPQALGWQRKARPDGCGFCQMLAGRAELYKSRDTADFGAHDHCHCLAVPAFGGKPVPVKPYTPTSRNITDADRARTRAWIKANL